MEFKIKKSHQKNFSEAIWNTACMIQIVNELDVESVYFEMHKNILQNLCGIAQISVYLKSENNRTFYNLKALSSNILRNHTEYLKQIRLSYSSSKYNSYTLVEKRHFVMVADYFSYIEQFKATHDFWQAVNIVEEFINERYLEWKKS